ADLHDVAAHVLIGAAGKANAVLAVVARARDVYGAGFGPVDDIFGPQLDERDLDLRANPADRPGQRSRLRPDRARHTLERPAVLRHAAVRHLYDAFDLWTGTRRAPTGRFVDR